MSADQFLQNASDVIFVVIFLLVVSRAATNRMRSDVDAALLFGAVALIVLETWFTEAAGIKSQAVLTFIISSLLMALPYLLLRLLDDFTGVPRRVMNASLGGLVLSVLILVVWHDGKLPGVLTLLLIAYFVALSVYDATGFIRASRHSSGITRRRMRSVALGTLALGLVIVVAGFQVALPSSTKWATGSISDALGLACGIAFFVGFTPPTWLRRAWQEPELRAFLGHAAALPRLPTTPAIVRELERGAASSLGTELAAIGLWNETDARVEYYPPDGSPPRPLRDALGLEAFARQRPRLSTHATLDNPKDADAYRSYNINSVLSIPITAGAKRLGVLTVYARKAPIFAEDDLTLAQLLADQAAVILESRALIDETARVQAREEATRLKDDFLSAAAHDLKTPLTALIAQAQLMERRARRNPDAPADTAGIERMVRESQRLKQLVTELLDVSRVEQGKLLGVREEVDLIAIARQVCDRQFSARHRVRLEADGSIVGIYDSVRIRQLIDNLIENAVKYSPGGGEVIVRIWSEGGTAHLTVSDRGIGIPAGDLDQLFDRFHRGTNVDDRRFAGMGLGLFICRGIVEQHGGQIWATSDGLNQGSTFYVALPLPESQPRTATPVPEAAAGAVPLSASLEAP